jgi:hypothetical protein
MPHKRKRRLQPLPSVVRRVWQRLEPSLTLAFLPMYCHVQPRPVTAASSMTRLIVAALCLAAFALNGCDNRTRDGVRWDQIAQRLKKDKNSQPWPDAESPWANAEHHSGTAW